MQDLQRRRQHQDGDALVDSGKWLSREDREALSGAVRTYFSKARLEPSAPPTAVEAWRFQGYFVLHLLNGSSAFATRSGCGWDAVGRRMV